MRAFLTTCSILSLTAAIGCSNSGKFPLTAPSGIPGAAATTEEAIHPALPAESAPASAETSSPKIKLINDLAYSGEEKILRFAGQAYETNFVKIDSQPYGFYIPDTLQEFTYEDGSEIGLNKSEFIALSEVDRLVHPENLHESLRFGGDMLFTDGDLTQYEEYIGSASDGNQWRRTDGFVFKPDNSPAMLVYFTYFNRNKEAVLPVFLEVVRNIKYIE